MSVSASRRTSPLSNSPIPMPRNQTHKTITRHKQRIRLLTRIKNLLAGGDVLGGGLEGEETGLGVVTGGG